MILRIKPLVGEERVVEIEPTDPIQTVKEKVQELEGTSVAQQRLIYQGKFLKNEKTVESYRLKNGAMLQMVKALRSRIYRIWLYQRYQNLALSQEVTFLLESLRKKFQIALITNGTSAAQWEKIDRLNLKDCFDLILVSGDLSYEKPDKNIFFEACDYLDVNPKNCLMVGDKLETDIQGGLEAGLAGTVWIPLGAHYNLAEGDPQPDYILRNVMELKHLLSNVREFEVKLKCHRKKGMPQKKIRKSPLFLDLSCDDESSCSSNVSFFDSRSQKSKYLHFCPEEDNNSNASDGS